jgi:hypothetical protein
MDIKTLLRPPIHFYWRLRNRIDIGFGKRSKHIVICGYPRGGTSLLYNMISASIGGFHCEEFEVPAVQRLHRSGNYVTKFPLDILNIDEIVHRNALFKDMYFIVLIRDVRDLVTSRHPLVPDRYFIGYKSSLWPQDPKFSKWHYGAPGIEAIFQAIRAGASRRDINVLTLRYEDLVRDTDGTQKRIEDFTDLKFSASFKSYHQREYKHAYKYNGRYEAKDASLARESTPVDASRVSKWKQPEHASIIYQQFSKYPELFDILIEYGYERDRTWFSTIKSPSVGTGLKD